ncbi:hypothetical protein DPEC_G00163000 [Dallia pectoralis]|uniref:Uncharacterized protein n=1 Tax=Dallia pectoralis TaxID=75939 RepID=A0ACC2GH65_DALPE|nr:hypothetical protein DPEC_G00163000 [Dallia pectoralis]
MTTMTFSGAAASEVITPLIRRTRIPALEQLGIRGSPDGSLNTGSPRRGHAYYALDETQTDINTVARFQSDYSAKPHQYGAANGRWRPPIQVASEQPQLLPGTQAPSSPPPRSPHAQPISQTQWSPFDKALPSALRAQA